MSDELTPEEKAAFDSLPRERMPAGLEAKVVDAMREHGFLAKHRRVIELSRGRVAGVLAASVALMIVAYSVGLHRGEGRDMIIPTETLTTPEPGIEKYPELSRTPTTLESDKDRKSESAAPEIGRAAPKTEPPADAVAQVEEKQALKKEAAPPPAPVVRRDEYVGQQNEAPASEVDLRATRIRDELTRSLQEPKPRAERSLQSTARPQSPSLAMESYSLSKPKEAITLLWGGDAYAIEADSVRVVEDERGRTLHIYTADGIIRIRLAE